MILEIKSDKASAKIDSLGAQLISFQDSQDTVLSYSFRL